MPVYDRSYFPGIRTCYSYNAADYVKYYFIATAEGTTTAKVYQAAASGAREKYSVDYGQPGATVTIPSVTPHTDLIWKWRRVRQHTARSRETKNGNLLIKSPGDKPI